MHLLKTSIGLEEAVRQLKTGNFAPFLIVRREYCAFRELLEYSLSQAYKSFQQGQNKSRSLDLEWLRFLAASKNVSQALALALPKTECPKAVKDPRLKPLQTFSFANRQPQLAYWACRIFALGGSRQSSRCAPPSSEGEGSRAPWVFVENEYCIASVDQLLPKLKKLGVAKEIKSVPKAELEEARKWLAKTYGLPEAAVEKYAAEKLVHEKIALAALE